MTLKGLQKAFLFHSIHLAHQFQQPDLLSHFPGREILAFCGRLSDRVYLFCAGTGGLLTISVVCCFVAATRRQPPDFHPRPLSACLLSQLKKPITVSFPTHSARLALLRVKANLRGVDWLPKGTMEQPMNRQSGLSTDYTWNWGNSIFIQRQ